MRRLADSEAGPAELRMVVGNTPESLGQAQACVRQFLEAHRIESSGRAQAMVIVDELAANVIAHAWPGDDGPHDFELSLSLRPDGSGPELLLVIEDDGILFDPTVPRSVDTESDLERLDLGGVGLVIVARTSDRFEYRRQGERNRVLVAKRLRTMPEQAGN